MSSGSGLFSAMAAKLVHLLTHGIAGEVADLRGDLAATFTPLAGIAVDEYLAPIAGGTTVLRAATATVASVQTFAWGTGLTDGGNKAALAAVPRQLSVTTGGATPAQAPASMTVTGFDIDGNAMSEVITPATTAATVNGKKCFAKITTVVLSAAGGTAATIAIGLTTALGLYKTVKLRGGAAIPIQDRTDGALSGTAGVITIPANALPHGAYTPNTVPNATHNYAVYYELDGATLVNKAAPLGNSGNPGTGSPVQ